MFSKGIHADVFVVSDRSIRVARKRNAASAEKECVGVFIDGDFDKVRIIDLFCFFQHLHHRGNRNGRILKKIDQSTKRFFFYEGCVALHVDDEIGGKIGGDLGNAVGPAFVFCFASYGFAAGVNDLLFDDLAIGHHDHFLKQSGIARCFVGASDHGCTAQVLHQFSRKSGSGIASRDQGGDDHDAKLLGSAHSDPFLNGKVIRSFNDSSFSPG